MSEEVTTDQPEPMVIKETEYKFLVQEKDFWRETALLAEEYIDIVATAKSMQIKVREYNQFVLKRHKIEKKYMNVLQYMYDKRQAEKEKRETQSLPDGR